MNDSWLQRRERLSRFGHNEEQEEELQTKPEITSLQRLEATAKEQTSKNLESKIKYLGINFQVQATYGSQTKEPNPGKLEYKKSAMATTCMMIVGLSSDTSHRIERTFTKGINNLPSAIDRRYCRVR